MALLISLASLQQKIRILNKFIHQGIKYALYDTSFSILDIKKLNKLLIKLTKSICNIPKDSLTSLPNYCAKCSTLKHSPYSRATTLSKQLTQTINVLGPLC
jgi:hypothetical protein